MRGSAEPDPDDELQQVVVADVAASETYVSQMSDLARRLANEGRLRDACIVRVASEDLEAWVSRCLRTFTALLLRDLTIGADRQPKAACPKCGGQRDVWHGLCPRCTTIRRGRSCER